VAAKGLVQRAVDAQRHALARVPARLDVEQFGGDVAYLLGRLALGLLPGVAAERMQRRQLRRAPE
jgi:hypothetical protein